MLTFSRAISRVNAELKTNVSEISTVSIIRIDMAKGCMSLIFIPVCQIDAFSVDVLCSRWAKSNCAVTHQTFNLSPCCLTWCHFCQTIFSFPFYMLFSVSSRDFRLVRVLKCLNKLLLELHALLFKPF
jgi:hypothetical protein